MTPKQALQLSRFLSGFQIRIGLPWKWSVWVAKKFIKWPKQPEMKIESGWFEASKRLADAGEDKILPVYIIEEPCKAGHVFLWVSGDTKEKNPPKGVPCQCGKCISDGKGGEK